LISRATVVLAARRRRGRAGAGPDFLGMAPVADVLAVDALLVAMLLLRRAREGREEEEGLAEDLISPLDRTAGTTVVGVDGGTV
jgi:hypothetical protein